MKSTIKHIGNVGDAHLMCAHCENNECLEFCGGHKFKEKLTLIPYDEVYHIPPHMIRHVFSVPNRYPILGMIIRGSGKHLAWIKTESGYEAGWAGERILCLF